jgi:hypothetical protein
MKKIMVLAAAAMIAGFASAAQVQWNVTGIAQDNSGTAYTGYSLYLCDASVYSASALAADLANGDFSKLSAAGFVQATSGSVQQGTTAFAKIASLYKGGDYTVGDSHTFYTLVLNGAADAATEFTISSEVTAKVPQSGALAMTFANLSNNAQVGWTEVAPEPTSGLLLLLGVAGLALKRKRA